MNHAGSLRAVCEDNRDRSQELLHSVDPMCGLCKQEPWDNQNKGNSRGWRNTRGKQPETEVIETTRKAPLLFQIEKRVTFCNHRSTDTASTNDKPGEAHVHGVFCRVFCITSRRSMDRCCDFVPQTELTGCNL